MRIWECVGKLGVLSLLGGLVLAGMMFPVVGAVGVVSNHMSDQVDSISSALVNTDPPLMSTITDRDGVPIAYLYDQYRVLTPADKISSAMKDALISVEDRRFYEHHGVDWLGTVRAAVTNQAGGSVSQGASTLTQQYVKNYLIHVVARNNKADQQKAQEQTIARKAREARIAIQLENELDKDEILARYLNVVPFGSTVYGIAAASQAYFDTTPDKLTVPQAAVLAGMVNSPIALDPEAFPDKAHKRRNNVMDLMVQNGKLARDEAEEFKKEPIVLQQPVRTLPNGCVGAGPAFGFYCSYVVNYLTTAGFSLEQLKTGGYSIRTPLDRGITEQAKQAAEAQVSKDTEGIANTMAIMQPGKDKHEVVALVANRDYGLKAEANQTQFDLPSGVENKFGAGSIYKIFTAAAAMEKGLGIENTIATPSHHVSKVFKGGAAGCPATGEPDTRWYCLSNNTDTYPPQMTLQTALATSPNTGFVILEEQVGLGAVIDMASRLGMRETMATTISGVRPDPAATEIEQRVSQAEYYKTMDNASFTLGPTPVNTLELANVAATLMSGGTWCPPSPVREVLDRNRKPVEVTHAPCEQVVAEPLANTLAVGLSKDDQPSGTSGAAARQFQWDKPMLGKTGTTEDYKSAAFVGATADYAGAVQTFNDGVEPRGICVSGTPSLCDRGNIYGGTVPARTWFDTMSKVHASLPAKPMPPTDERYVKGGPEIRIPDVVGAGADGAKDSLEKAGYKVTVQTVNSGQARGTVVGQSPRGTALTGTTVTLSISSGYVPPPQPAEPVEPSVVATTARPPAQTDPATPPPAPAEPPVVPPPVAQGEAVVEPQPPVAVPTG